MDWSPILTIATITGILVGVVTGLAGTVLGLRAEWRARLGAGWSVNARATSLTLINRTGHDAHSVRVSIRRVQADGRRVQEVAQAAFVNADGQLDVEHEAGPLEGRLIIRWSTATGSRRRWKGIPVSVGPYVPDVPMSYFG